ncbi:Hypothetical predicted protein [Podarcis lilfordi]|uniref:Uncharacterized protein n=1 Tax=Podarcis lilfordi TaxID=74358 RepID=A0AA35NSK1_9SAUR|nr:Hypothetical predicted protein [Podarcis lilfordi]
MGRFWWQQSTDSASELPAAKQVTTITPDHEECMGDSPCSRGDGGKKLLHYNDNQTTFIFQMWEQDSCGKIRELESLACIFQAIGVSKLAALGETFLLCKSFEYSTGLMILSSWVYEVVQDIPATGAPPRRLRRRGGAGKLSRAGPALRPRQAFVSPSPRLVRGCCGFPSSLELRRA